MAASSSSSRPTQATATFGDIVLSAAFDSGNCARFEQVTVMSPLSARRCASLCPVVQVDPCNYNLWLSKDCEGTEFETGYTTWFHFWATGLPKYSPISFTIRNMNRQAALFTNGFKPVTKSMPGKPTWAPVAGAADFSVREIVC